MTAFALVQPWCGWVSYPCHFAPISRNGVAHGPELTNLMDVSRTPTDESGERGVCRGYCVTLEGPVRVPANSCVEFIPKPCEERSESWPG
jgi:hypothetical protein